MAALLILNTTPAPVFLTPHASSSQSSTVGLPHPHTLGARSLGRKRMANLSNSTSYQPASGTLALPSSSTSASASASVDPTSALLLPVSTSDILALSSPSPVLNPQGLSLAGLLLDPPSSPPAPLVILCHGFRSSKKSRTLESVATALYNEGVATYRFDFAGNGESEGEFTVGNYWAEAEDLRAVVEHWRGQGRIIAGILGHSKGGNVVLLYASKFGDVPCVVNLCARCNMAKGVRERYGDEGLRAIEELGFLKVDNQVDGSYTVTKAGLAERLNTDMVAAARVIPPECRILTVHGSEDDTVPVEDAWTFAEHIRNHQLAIVEGGNHRFSREHQKAMLAEVIPFIVASAQLFISDP